MLFYLIPARLSTGSCSNVRMAAWSWTPQEKYIHVVWGRRDTLRDKSTKSHWLPNSIPSSCTWVSSGAICHQLGITGFQGLSAVANKVLTHKSSVEHHPKVHEEDSTLSDIEPISRIMWQTFGFGNTQLPPEAILKGSKCKPHVACKIKGTCLWDRGLEDIYNMVQPHPSTVLSRALGTWLCVTQDTQ